MRHSLLCDWHGCNVGGAADGREVAGQVGDTNSGHMRLLYGWLWLLYACRATAPPPCTLAHAKTIREPR
jgi:hypothetical protein